MTTALARLFTDAYEHSTRVNATGINGETALALAAADYETAYADVEHDDEHAFASAFYSEDDYDPQAWEFVALLDRYVNRAMDASTDLLSTYVS